MTPPVGTPTATNGPIIVVGADAGQPPVVKVFDKAGNELFTFNAYDPSFLGGVRTAVGDVNNDGFLDIVTAPGQGGGPHVKVFYGSATPV